MLQRICAAIRKLLERMAYLIIFNHLERARNIAGLLLEQRRRKEEEKLIMHRYEKYYGSLDLLQGLMVSPYELTTSLIY